MTSKSISNGEFEILSDHSKSTAKTSWIIWILKSLTWSSSEIAYSEQRVFLFCVNERCDHNKIWKPNSRGSTEWELLGMQWDYFFLWSLFTSKRRHLFRKNSGEKRANWHSRTGRTGTAEKMLKINKYSAGFPWVPRPPAPPSHPHLPSGISVSAGIFAETTSR